jgi:hypothetical protein
MLNMGGVNGQLEKRVQVAWVLFQNEPPFLVEGLDVELFVRCEHIWVEDTNTNFILPSLQHYTPHVIA